MTTPNATLNFGGLAVFPPLFLAPMAGLTHSALRTALLLFQGVGLLSTEMLAATSLPHESTDSPYLVRTPAERPLSYQLLCSAEDQLAPALARLHDLGADALDLNLGCPAPQARKKGGGAALMEKPEQLRRVVAAARKRTNLPLSAKIRLGESLDADKLRGLCLMLQDEGLDLLTVHARLRGESFARRPHWDWVAKIKTWLRIPVVANGAIDSVASARACLAISGADGLMIGRRAASAPWIFAAIAREVYGVDLPEMSLDLTAVYEHVVSALEERFPSERRLGRLKEFTHHFARNYLFGHQLAGAVQASASFAEARARARAFFSGQGPDENIARGELRGEYAI